jgi:hypothetical protein
MNLCCHLLTSQNFDRADDSSHQRPDRQTRDDQVETLLKTAGLPFLRVPAARSYNVAQLSTAIHPHLFTVP